MTPTLESALSGLPAKPRVHELSKRIGISNKELLAALADRGLTVSSASSSVPLAVAQELIESLLGGEPADPADDSAMPDPTSGRHRPSKRRSRVSRPNQRSFNRRRRTFPAIRPASPVTRSTRCSCHRPSSTVC